MSTRARTVPPLTLGWRLQMALDQAGLKYPELMLRFEVSRGTVSRWCRDIGPRPKRFILEAIADMCGVPPEWFLDAPSPSNDGNAAQRIRPPTVLRRPRPKSDGKRPRRPAKRRLVTAEAPLCLAS